MNEKLAEAQGYVLIDRILTFTYTQLRLTSVFVFNIINIYSAEKKLAAMKKKLEEATELRTKLKVNINTTCMHALTKTRTRKHASAHLYMHAHTCLDVGSNTPESLYKNIYDLI